MCFSAYGGVAQKLLLEFGKSVSSPSINEGASDIRRSDRKGCILTDAAVHVQQYKTDSWIV